MDSGTGISSFGSQKCLNLPSDGRPAWRILQTLAESNAPPSGKASESNRPVLEGKGSASNLKEYDYIGLAENSAFDQPRPADVQNGNEHSLDGTDLHLELGLALGTASTRMNDCEKYADFLLKHKDVLEAQKEGASKALFETSRFMFPEAGATFQKPWQNARPVTADCLNSANRTTRDYQLPSKSPTFLQDLDGGHSKASLSNLHCSSVKNGTKRGYTEAMHDVPRFDNGSGVPAAGKAAEKEAKVLPKHQQGPYLPTYLQPKPIGSAHWMVGSEKSSMHAFVPGNEKASENANVALNPTKNCKEPATNDSPPPKGQVVGWPPIRSYRKQNLAKPTEMFVKVNMEGMTVGRKVDLNAHSSYEGLYLALEEMFQPSSNGGQGSFQSLQGRESHVHDAKQVTLLNGSEYVLTYEDQDGDWMMVGDVPWSMFVNMVRRLRIARKPEATGLAPTRRPEIVK